MVEEAPPPHPPLELADGVPDVTETPEQLARVVLDVAAGTGPVALDAERASGYRYSQRAYLVQLRRGTGPTALIDPIALPDLSTLGTALGDAEWVLHAANQDLACLAEVGLRPPRLFDTELAARLAGHERVGLATMVATVLGRRLDKGQSSADWSQRPLTTSLLRYAALDVEVLLDLRDHLERELREQGKWAWALEEFAAVATATTAAPRVDPWRRTSGLHRLRTTRQYAVVRALWTARDEHARARDIAPGRVLPDAAIIEAAIAAPASREALAALPSYRGRGTRRRLDQWWGAVESALALPPAELPRVAGPGDGGPPPAHRWAERDPVAASRLNRVRAAVLVVAAEHALPTENLLEPAVLRRVTWTPPAALDADTVGAALAQHGARAWQVTLLAGPVAEALQQP